MPTKTMTALRAHQRGGSDQLHVEEAPIPEPMHDEILVEVRAAGITFSELTWEETWTRDGKSRLPIVPAHEFSGVVSRVGIGVRTLHPGDEVFGLVPFDRDGAAASYVSVPVKYVATKPAAISHRTAAALPLAGLTAWQALIDHGHLNAGERVLVHGGAGAVGTIAVQLATALGADVTSTARAADADFVRSLGANGVVEMERFDDEPSLYDLIVDTIGGEIASRSIRTLRAGGRLICLTAPAPATERSDIQTEFFIVVPMPAVLEELAQLVIRAELQVPIADVYPLALGQDAYASGLKQGRRPGKTLIEIYGRTPATASLTGIRMESQAAESRRIR